MSTRDWWTRASQRAEGLSLAKDADVQVLLREVAGLRVDLDRLSTMVERALPPQGGAGTAGR